MEITKDERILIFDDSIDIGNKSIENSDPEFEKIREIIRKEALEAAIKKE